MKVSLDKQYRTREGKKVRLWTVDAKCDIHYPVHGEILFGDVNPQWNKKNWTAHGRYCLGEVNCCDLVEYSPPKLRPYRNEELPELRGRWIRSQDWAEHESQQVIAIGRDSVATLFLLRKPAELMEEFVFAEGDPEAGKPVAREVRDE